MRVKAQVKVRVMRSGGKSPDRKKRVKWVLKTKTFNMGNK